MSAEVDEAVERAQKSVSEHDPRRGRGWGGTVTEQLEKERLTDQRVLESAL